MQLQGIIPPMITPFTAAGALDIESARRLVGFMLEAGVDGFFIAGTMGEGAALGAEERAELTRSVAEAVHGRALVLAGISDVSQANCITNARQARAAGADAVVAMQPYFFRGWRSFELRDFFRGITDAAELPVIIYNNPILTGNTLDIDTVAELAADPRIIGIKDSSSNFAFFMELLRLREQVGQFAVFQGDETAVAASLLCGADGAVAGLGSLAGRVFKGIYQAAQVGDAAEAMRLQKMVLALFDGIYAPDRHRWLTGHKEALASLGIIASPYCRVYSPVTATERDAIQSCVQAHRAALLG